MNKFLLGLVILAIGGVFGWYYFGRGAGLIPADTGRTGTSPTPTPTGGQYQFTEESLPGTGGTGTGATKGGLTETSQGQVAYTDNGFVPATLTVPVGTTVTFRNDGSGKMWVASAVHPTHQLLPGFDQLKSVGRGGTYQYTFTKVGTWKYHNHVKAADTATVVVTQ